jgi:hypothetical protein
MMETLLLFGIDIAVIVIINIIIIIIIITEINDRRGSTTLTTRHPSIHKSWH